MVVKLYCRGENLQTNDRRKKVPHERFPLQTTYRVDNGSTGNDGENDDNDGDVGNDAGILQMIFSRVWEFTQDCYKSQTIIFY